MPPTTPYVTSELASILLQNMFRGQVPNAQTPVSDYVFGQLITWSDSLINSWFAGVGYKIPFATLSGETWPAHQTTFLQMMSAVGSAAMASGYVPMPAPASRPSSSRSKNLYAQMLDSFRDAIKENGLGFRAQFWAGKPAERWCTEPTGPRTEFYDGYYDPSRYELFKDYTDRVAGVFSDMEELNLDWDYLYELTLSSTD